MVLMRRIGDIQDRQILASTYGALLFGVPNHGMNTTAMTSMIENLPTRFTLSLLDQNFGYRLREQQHEEFCNAFYFKDSKIVQFYELRLSPTVRKVRLLLVKVE